MRLLASSTVGLLALSVGASQISVPGAPGDHVLARVLALWLPRVEAAARAANSGFGSPDAIQAQYDAARDAQDELSRARSISRGCESLHHALQHYLRAEVTQAEGVDRFSRSAVDGGLAAASTARGRLMKLPRNCSGGDVIPLRRTLPEPLAPKSGEAFTGVVRASKPRSATSAEILVDARVAKRLTVRWPILSVHLSGPLGRHRLAVRFRSRTAPVERLEARDVWLLPMSARLAVLPRRRDRDLDARLATLARGFAGHVAIWVEDLRSGVHGSWNEDARFPAASTVKLAVLFAALRKFGPRPERSIVAYDLEQLTGWSSNLAANRLLVKLAGSEQAGARLAEEVLARLGARSSTYTGDYRVGSVAGRTPAAPDPPPLVSRRVTTARDLATILRALDRASLG